jgi:hypothetical protein
LRACLSLALCWSVLSFGPELALAGGHDAGVHDPHALAYTGYDGAFQSAVRNEWPEGPDWLWWKAQNFQESRFDRFAVSPVGAMGLCQVMPATAADWKKHWFPQGTWGDVNPHDAAFCIIGGAKYMRQLQRFQAWRAWPIDDRHRMSLASYNAGAGWIIKAVNACGASSWATTAPCLERFTGTANARQTTDYVRLIAKWREMLP